MISEAGTAKHIFDPGEGANIKSIGICCVRRGRTLSTGSGSMLLGRL